LQFYTQLLHQSAANIVLVCCAVYEVWACLWTRSLRWTPYGFCSQETGMKQLWLQVRHGHLDIFIELD